ncbi:unnamed protein product, partial [marine sediment metagenome]
IGMGSIKKNLTRLIDKKKISEDRAGEILSKITKVTEYEAAHKCGLVVEAINEEIEAKKDLFTKLDNICKPETILASNTSSLSITEIASISKRSDKVIGMHFFNPAPVMRLVEIIRGVNTSDETVNTVKEIVDSIGKESIEVSEGPGFVVNRILIPMINEAIGVLGDGLASKEDIDKAMTLGANHPIGPLALADLIGNDICLSILEVLLKETGDPKYRPHSLLRKMVRAGYFGRKCGKGFYEY